MILLLCIQIKSIDNMKKRMFVPDESENRIGSYINGQQTGKRLDLLNSLIAEARSVDLDLATVDNNPFAIIGQFRMQAQKEHWTDEEITAVQKEAMSGNLDHLKQTISNFSRRNSSSHSA
jgi:hypothetical protein